MGKGAKNLLFQIIEVHNLFGVLFLFFGLVDFLNSADNSHIRIFSEKSIGLYVEAGNQSKLLLTIPNFATVVPKCLDNLKPCPKSDAQYLRVEYGDHVGFIQLLEAYQIHSQLESPKKDFKVLIVSKIAEDPAAYRRENIVIIMNSKKTISFKEKYFGPPEILWLNNKILHLKTASADAGAFSETTYQIDAESGLREVFFGVFGASYGGGPHECAPINTCFCSFEVYKRRDRKYYFENGGSVYRLKLADFEHELVENKKANTFCFKPNYDSLEKLSGKTKFKKVKNIRPHTKGLEMDADGRKLLLDYDSNSVVPFPLR